MNMDDKIHLGYIYTLDDVGYVDENKFVKEIAINEIPKVGENIVTFYNEVKPFYNLNYFDHNEKVHYIIENNKFTKVDPNKTADYLNTLLEDYVALIGNVTCINLHGTREDLTNDTSKYYMIKMGLERNFGLTFNPVEQNFTVEKYQDIHNQLRVYAGLEEPSTTMLVNRLLRGVNTLLAIDEIIPYSHDSRLFSTYNDIDEEEKEHLDYSGASRDIGGLLEYYAIKTKRGMK